jgi:hypothetical protein
MMGNMKRSVQSTTLSKDTWALCGTKHHISAGITGDGNVGDKIIVKFKAEDTGGVGTGYSSKNGELHKVRITIENNGEVVYQQDQTGSDSGWVEMTPFSITKKGRWEVKAKTIAASDCAKPEGEKTVGYFDAEEKAIVENDEGEENEKNLNENDLTPLLSVG